MCVCVCFFVFFFPFSLFCVVQDWSRLTIYPLQLWRIDENTFNFRASNKDFIGLGGEGEGEGIKVFAHAAEPGPNETFIIVRNVENPNRVRIVASNNLYLQVNYL